MKSMALKFEPIKRQKFDIGRTINPIKCQDCETCDFMNCKNYAVRMKQSKYNIEEWYNYYKEELHKPKSLWNLDIINAMFDDLITGFPKGLYWDYSKAWEKIKFMEITRNGNERVLGEINLKRYEMFNMELYEVLDIDLSKTRKKFIDKVVKTMKQIESLVE